MKLSKEQKDKIVEVLTDGVSIFALTFGIMLGVGTAIVLVYALGMYLNP